MKKLNNAQNITKIRPLQRAETGKFTIQIYENGKLTVGIKTGIKPGPHYGGTGNLKNQN